MSALKCTHCGQQVREEWLRCPRCRELLETEGPPAAASAPTPDAVPLQSAKGMWLAGVGVLALGVIGAGVAIRANLPPAAVAAGESMARPIVRPKPERVAATSAEAAAEAAEHETLDALRSGAAAYNAGDLSGALGRYQAAVAASPDDPEARNNLAQVLVRLGRTREAMPHFDEAIRLDPERWAYRFNRGRAYAQLERWNDAVRDYRQASQISPDDYPAYYNLGLALMRLKQYPEAAESLEQAVAKAPGEPTFLITLGTAYVGAERPDRARATFERFLVAFPDDAEAEKVKALLQAMTEAGQ
jgi:tetratricopeptide (TPR) repeat protein